MNMGPPQLSTFRGPCYNELLANLCTERNWGLIKNTNITKDHLNNYGLHLNKGGRLFIAHTKK